MSFIMNQTGLLSNQSQIDVQFYNFLQEFFLIFEAYAGNQIYITGESYAGVRAY
jgi:carboxypeptidase C (cathepsin A)